MPWESCHIMLESTISSPQTNWVLHTQFHESQERLLSTFQRFKLLWRLSREDHKTRYTLILRVTKQSFSPHGSLNLLGVCCNAFLFIFNFDPLSFWEVLDRALWVPKHLDTLNPSNSDFCNTYILLGQWACLQFSLVNGCPMALIAPTSCGLHCNPGFTFIASSNRL